MIPLIFPELVDPPIAINVLDFVFLAIKRMITKRVHDGWKTETNESDKTTTNTVTSYKQKKMA